MDLSLDWLQTKIWPPMNFIIILKKEGSYGSLAGNAYILKQWSVG